MAEVAGSPAGTSAVHDKNTGAADTPGGDRALVDYAGARLEPRTVRGTQGGSGLEISRLLATFGVVAPDPGYANTGSTTSAVTYIDGEAGILRYRVSHRTPRRVVELPGDQPVNSGLRR